MTHLRIKIAALNRVLKALVNPELLWDWRNDSKIVTKAGKVQ